MTFIIGLTGGIATGKSTVSNLFRSQDAEVIDADEVAREVVEPNTIGLAKIVESFGTTILLEDNSLNRKKLGSIIFKDKEKRAQLNALLHGEIREAIKQQIADAKNRKVKLLVLDIPLLYEAHYENLLDQIMVVYCSEKIQLQRLMTRDALTKKEALARMDSQLSIEEKKKRADWVIDNSGSIEETVLQWNNWYKMHSTEWSQ